MSVGNSPEAWTERAQVIDESWDACRWSENGQRRRHEEIVAVLEPRHGERLLDYGCGTGDLIDSLLTDVEYVGFDWSLGMVARASKEREFAGIEFTTQLRDGDTWDLIVACGPFNLPENWSKGHTYSVLSTLWPRCRRATAVSLYAGADPACLIYTIGDLAEMGSALLKTYGGSEFRVRRGYLPNDLMLVVSR